MGNGERRPRLFVFAGANGSGKSTIIDHYLKSRLCPLDYICPDQLVPADKKNDATAYVAAMEEAERRRIDNVAAKRSFTFETVFSYRDKLDFINFAKSEGYFVTVIYVITSSSDINIERVKRRVEQGGHGVPEDKIAPRYERAMGLMFEVIDEAHEALIFDNSGETPKIIFAKYQDGRYNITRPFPQWAKKYCKDAALLKILE